MIFDRLTNGEKVWVRDTDMNLNDAVVLVDGYKTFIQYDEDGSVHEVTEENQSNVLDVEEQYF